MSYLHLPCPCQSVSRGNVRTLQGRRLSRRRRLSIRPPRGRGVESPSGGFFVTDLISRWVGRYRNSNRRTLTYRNATRLGLSAGADGKQEYQAISRGYVSRSGACS